MPMNLPPDDLNVPPELLEAWNRHPAIVKYGHTILRQVAKPVIRLNEVRDLIQRMEAIMEEASGLGLAAPQVGVSTRVIMYRLPDEKVRVLVNPKIISMRGEQLDPEEGCLSIPGLQGKVRRAKEIRVKGFDERNRPVSRRVTDLEARVIQHEVDHLDGILFIDRAEQGTLEWVFGGDNEDGNAAPRE
jgi:peptide deformylase